LKPYLQFYSSWREERRLKRVAIVVEVQVNKMREYRNLIPEKHRNLEEKSRNTMEKEEGSVS
jgi:hypothetical protein